MMIVNAPGKARGASQQGPMSTVKLEFDGPVARLLIDNPRRRNAMNRAMWRAVPDRVAEACARPATRVVVLQSRTPGAFCSGADIGEFESTYATPEEAQRSVDEIARACDAMAECDRPTLALIDGVCVGGGMSLVLGCDMRLASRRASFSITPAKLGLSYHPDDIARLVALCGPALASELLFAAQPWSAERCRDAGLVNRAIADDGFADECEALLQAIAQQSLDAQRALKLGIAAAVSGEPARRTVAMRDFLALFSGGDFVEGRNAFLGKRPPVFPSHRNTTQPE